MNVKDIADLLGRICISVIFFFEAFDATVYFQKTKHTMTAYGVTWNQDFLLYSLIVFLVLGGTMVLIGYYSNIGAILLLLYWIPFTVIVYDFWNHPPAVQRVQALGFMRNIAIAGGLFLLIAHGAGKYSVRRLIHVLRLPK